jgi:hypothetical protein
MHAPQCPFNDPHTAAPYLWLLRQEEAVRLEFSCAAVAGTRSILRGTEDMLLWHHRVELGCPTEGNYGRFYPGWSRPTNRWIHRGGVRVAGRAAGRLSDYEPSHFGVTEPALNGDGPILSATWWERVSLSNLDSLPERPAVYCVFDQALISPLPVYVGETLRLQTRATAHAAARWPIRDPWLAYRVLPARTPKFVLHELESDILGWHF